MIAYPPASADSLGMGTACATDNSFRHLLSIRLH